jgi:Protein of unknown function (DUF1479)
MAMLAVKSATNGFVDTAVSTPRKRVPKLEGDISSVFASLAGDKKTQLPPRFGQLKREIIGQHGKAILESWKRLIPVVEAKVREANAKGPSIFPEVEFADIVNGKVDPDSIDRIKRAGVCIVRNAIPKEEAAELLSDVRDYIQTNPTTKGNLNSQSKLIIGFPADDPQIWELYWSQSQLRARSHPSTLQTTTWLNTAFFHTRDPSVISLSRQLSYADRLRIRHPGDAKFALGPHVDGGGLERWEIPTYRKVYHEILTGNWENFDSYDATHRATANMEMYATAGGCSVFRSWQGWLSLSETGPNEGTLKVFPSLKEASAYWILRPFVRLNSCGEWELDTSSTEFHGAAPGRGQELFPRSHPHLGLPNSLPSLPIMRPGDFVFWQGDAIHAVESVHEGKNQAIVMYIPSVPLCDMNVDYIRAQREAFLEGIPPPDFPGGIGESKHVGKGQGCEIKGNTARAAFGLERFQGEEDIIKRANTILGF